MKNAIQQTLLATVYDVAQLTPLDKAVSLSESLGANVYLKREDLQPIHSFKIRGAYNKISQLTALERERGVIAASAGNHAQGVALAANKLGLSALIVMPRTTPPIKVNAVIALGASVELFGDNYSDAAEHCKLIAKKTKRTYIHPFNDPLVMAGQGTIGKEILEQLPTVTHIFVPVGGGGLIAGIAQYVKELRPDITIISVEPHDSNVLQKSLLHNERVILSHVGIFADGVAVKQLGEHTYTVVKKYVDKAITVSNDEICAAIKDVFEETRSIVEPAGALAVAGIKSYAKSNDITGAVLVAINSGANMTFERLQFIAERTLLGSEKEAIFSIELPEKPGALRNFCNTVINGHSITQFGYRLSSRAQANILVGIGISSEADKQLFISNLDKQEYVYSDLSNDDIAKEHVRHMIGGPAAAASHELFYHINFPERPGALNDFLAAVSGAWNISLFHYRGLGGDTGSVLIGFEATDKRKLEDALSNAGYDWQNVTHAKSLDQFIRL